jgi:magnesium chelatase family protein
MNIEEILEVSRIYSAVGMPRTQDNSYIRPFRSPHHTISRIGLIGGGANPKPGEISLAHRGVLFLDELPEFPRYVLEALRQPLEDGKVTVSRAAGSVTFPSRFLLLSASNPCPCGYLGHPKKHCSCLPGGILKYHKRLSGPLLDRIDLHIDVPAVDQEKLTAVINAESSDIIRKRVMKARDIQKIRLKNTKVFTNGEMSSAQVREYCKMSLDAQNMLKTAIDKFSLSARSYFKTIKISQTIADLAGHDSIESEHVSEALQYRFHED